ncbi:MULTISPECIES: hypothetical protein [unclassified Streptomyces]|uniref:Spore-associated protein A n=1 Tax=Streptomyces sp. NBC_00060 TaxID=2975636 RepID=A0AAU2GT56_9ACTN
MARTKRTLTVALAAAAVAATGFTGTAAAAPAAKLAGVRCVGTSFSGTLNTNMAICNSGYTVTMQDNGDLVLRRSNGSPCYASGTRAPGDASATFNKTLVGPPYLDINSVSQGQIGRVWGAHNFTQMGTNASVNNKGEFYVGYKKVGYC